MTDPFTALIIELAINLRVPPSTAAMLVPLLIIFANRLARAIPDNVTGWKYYVRLAAKVIGMHIKDNSGVPATLGIDGTVTRKTPIETVPEPIVVEDNAIPAPNMFTQKQGDRYEG